VEIEEHLKNADISEIEVRNWPANYPYFKKVDCAFTNLNYDSKLKELNQYLDVADTPFSELICYNELKKLNQSIKQGFSFRQLDSEFLSAAYRLVTMSRARKGYPVTMSLPGLQQAFYKCPDDYLLFGVFKDDDLIAAAISIKLNSEVIYNFYHADHDDYRSFSPTVFLLSGIYQYCQRNDFNCLDLGISTSNGLVNKGLFRFKENIGCKQSDKSIFSKSI
jgi:lipid II:glycine glycyltransferase (peptidoglycan interpeptide bridge formation enzyme)